ncbi:MAG: STAS domain-containing protein [Planctomycetaceae bacterium]|nr:STAS domain-containing protein [Planctomycetaceae bacterium]
MHINVEHGPDFATLHLRGEFDSFYCPQLLQEVEALQKGGVTRLVLNLRLVKFINSTALGTIVKISKQLNSSGGKLVIARPSNFARDMITKVGINRLVPMFDTDEDAQAALAGAKKAAEPAPAADLQEGESSVLFNPTDPKRIDHFVAEVRRVKGIVNPVHGHAFGSNWVGRGRMASLDEKGLHFTWNGGDTGLDVFAMGQFLAIGTEVRVKFRLPLFQSGFCEAIALVSEVEERDGGVKIGATFSRIEDRTLAAVRQYSADLKFLKDELRNV